MNNLIISWAVPVLSFTLCSGFFYIRFSLTVLIVVISNRSLAQSHGLVVRDFVMGEGVEE